MIVFTLFLSLSPSNLSKTPDTNSGMMFTIVASSEFIS